MSIFVAIMVIYLTALCGGSFLLKRMLKRQRSRIIEMERVVVKFRDFFDNLTSKKEYYPISDFTTAFKDCQAQLNNQYEELQRLRDDTAKIEKIDFYLSVFTFTKPLPQSDVSGQSKYLNNIVNFWELFQFLLPLKIRHDAFEPAYNEIKKDYLLALKYHSKWAKRWLCVCFLMQTLYMIADCFRVLIGSKIRSALLVLVPLALREIIHRFLGG